jgi:hypothetical protein
MRKSEPAAPAADAKPAGQGEPSNAAVPEQGKKGLSHRLAFFLFFWLPLILLVLLVMFRGNS